MDVPKPFDFIPHDLFISKVNVYEFWMDFVTHFSLLLKRRNQNTRIDYCI